MRQLLKRTCVLLPLLALLALPAEGFGQVSGRPWSQNTATIPGEKMPDGQPAQWFFFQDIDAGILVGWNAMAANASKWHSNEECQDAMDYTRDAIQFANIQAGIGSSSLAGEYFGPLTETSTTNDADVIVIHVQVASSPGGFGTLIEEAWHRGTGDDDDAVDELNVHLDTMYAGRSLQSCHDEAREEEEEDDDEPCGAAADGMAADCGNPVTPTETCTETQQYVRWTDWEWVSKWEWVAKAVSVQTDDGWDFKVVAVQVDNGSYQQVQKGEWQTVRECTTTTGEAT